MKRIINKINYFLVILLIIFSIIILLLCLFGFDSIIKTIKGFNYSFITSIVSILALIITIINNRKYQNQNIEAIIRSNNQIEFEKELYNILNIYNQLAVDMSLLKVDTEISPNNTIIMKECISSWNDCTIKYQYLLDDIEHKIFYFYKYYNDFEHTELDKLIKDIQGLNQSLKLKLAEYSKLSVKAYEINGKFSKANCLADYDKKMESLDNVFDDIKVIIHDSADIIMCISNLIMNKKNVIYTEALNCIKERERLIKIHNLK